VQDFTKSGNSLPRLTLQLGTGRVLLSLARLLIVAGLAGLSPPVSAQGGAQPAPKLVMLIAGQSYETERTLPVFAAQFLEPQFRVVVLGGAMTHSAHRFDRLEEEITDADLLLV